MYNKNQYKKFNSKKILHKVKKQWVTISLTLLMMIGGGAVASHVTHAATTANVPAVSTTHINKSQTSASADGIQKNATNLHRALLSKSLVDNDYSATNRRNINRATTKLKLGASTFEHLTPQPANTTDVSKVKGMHAYLSNDKKTLTVTGNMRNYHPSNNSDYGLDKSDNDYSSGITTLNLGNVYNFTNASNLFKNMSDLTTINQVGDWNTSHVTNMKGMFDTDNLTNITPLSHWNTSHVTNMEDMFFGNSDLANITPLSHWNTSHVTNTNNMFTNVTQLTSLAPLSHWNTSNFTNISNMFSNDSTSFDLRPLSHWNTSHVTNMSGMFAGNSLSDITPLNHWNTSHVTNMSGMFAGDDLTDITPLSHWDTSHVINMDDMFSGDNLTDITPLSHWNTSHVTNMGMFDGNFNLANITSLSHWNTSHVTNQGMENMFDGDKFLLDKTPIPGWHINSDGTVKPIPRQGRYYHTKHIHKHVTKRPRHMKRIRKHVTKRHRSINRNHKHIIIRHHRIKRTNKRSAKRAIKGINPSRYHRALRKSNYVLRHGRRHASHYAYRMAKKFAQANNAEKKAYRNFVRKHTNRNRKAVNKAITNLNNLVNALLK